MKTFLLGGALGLAIVAAGTAGAADLAAAYKAPAVASPTWSWSGCYIGGHLGWGVADPQLGDATPSNVLTSAGAPLGIPTGLIDEAALGRSVRISDDNGPLLGGQIGCDYQFSGNYVVGISASAAGANINGNLLDPFQANGPTNEVDAKTDFLGAVSGRLGMVWRQFLFYGKGGVAFAHNTYTVNCGCDFDGAAPFRGTNTATGAVAGAGVEWAFANDWSAFVEYNHYFFDRQTLSFSSAFSFLGPLHAAVNVSQPIDAVKVGVNYHFR
jgi:outer membrane immunogenic protein